jgi:hypothetical protein
LQFNLNVGAIPCSTTSTAPVTVTLTNNVRAPDTVTISNSAVVGIVEIDASATIPDGNIVTAVQAAIPPTNLTSGTIGFFFNQGEHQIAIKTLSDARRAVFDHLVKRLQVDIGRLRISSAPWPFSFLTTAYPLSEQLNPSGQSTANELFVGSPHWTRFELSQPKPDCDRTRGRALFSE